ncbi:MAG: hypothetical protein S4CHLAM27_06090 [Chlamydiia bacterium]|nr:hypothetical protein [Chlamydiia bacterium]
MVKIFPTIREVFMLKNTLLISTLCLATMPFAFGQITPAQPVPVAYATPVYTDTWTYDTSAYFNRYTTRITNHKGFSNVYLDDGSVWKIDFTYDQKEIQKWTTADTLYLYKSPYSYSSTYELHNLNRNTCVDAEISCSSDPALTFYIEISAIHTAEGVVTLFDLFGNAYDMEIHTNDLHSVSNWSIGDCIVFGWNKPSAWDSTPYTYTLINMNKSISVRANRRLYL